MRWLAGVALILSLFKQASAQMVISEVMFDPEGSEFYDEFIELQNIGDIAVDLDGGRVGDVKEVDALVGPETKVRSCLLVGALSSWIPVISTIRIRNSHFRRM